MRNPCQGGSHSISQDDKGGGSKGGVSNMNPKVCSQDRCCTPQPAFHSSSEASHLGSDSMEHASGQGVAGNSYLDGC